MIRRALPLVLCAAGIAAAQELPERIYAELETVRLAAEKGDSGPAVKAIAAIGSRSLTPSQREAVASEFLELGDELTTLKVEGAALDVYRALAATFADTEVSIAAGLGVVQALEKLGDRKAALKVCQALVGPAPKASRAARLARAKHREGVLRRCAKLLVALKRPAEAVQAVLDAEVWHRRRNWNRTSLVSPIDLGQALHALCPTFDSEDADHDEALAAALELTLPTLRKDAAGKVVGVEMSVPRFVGWLVELLRAHRAPKTAAALTKRVPRPVPARGYRLPSHSRESLARLRGWQARVRRERARLPKLKERAKAGDVHAQYGLAELYDLRCVAHAPEARITALLDQAAHQGHGAALLERASRTHPRARRKVLQAALTAGVATAIPELLRKPGPLTPQAQASARRIAERGNGMAWLLLAVAAEDPKARYRLLLRAAREGEWRSFLRLSELTARGGPGVPADRNAALFWRRLAVATGQYRARLHWPEAIRRGGDWRARLDAAAKRYPTAANELALIELEGGRTQPAINAALAGLGILTADPFDFAPPSLSTIWTIRLRDRATSPAILAALAKRTDPAGLFLYAFVSGRGKLGLKADPARGMALFRRSARLAKRPVGSWSFALVGGGRAGLDALEAEEAWADKARKTDAWAEAYRGRLHQYGLWEVRDLDAARACYERAAKRGSPLGHLGLAHLEESLQQIEDRNRPSVVTHYRKAAELGYRPAWVNLAYRLGDRGDAKGAAAAWAKAVAAGEPMALLREAQRLLRGKQPDTGKALPLLRKAAAAGSTGAYVRLLVLLHERPSLRIAGDP